MTSKIDINALRELQKDLWPPPPHEYRFKVKAKRLLTVSEVELICSAIEQNNLMTEMFSANMFGGYGMDIFEHELYPGTGPNFLCRISEYDLPAELSSKHSKPSMGSGSDDAWKLFSKYTHSEQNKRWLAMYKMPAPREQSHYDY